MAYVIWSEDGVTRKAVLPRETDTLEQLKSKPFADGTPYIVLPGDHPAGATPPSQLSVDFNAGTVTIIPAVLLPSEAEYAGAIQQHVDAIAQARGYGNGAMIASYAASTVPAWAAEAKAFIAWRDAVWLSAYGLLAAVKAGESPAPTIDALIGRLPQVDWPPS